MGRWFLFAALAGCYRPSAAADCAVACAGGCPDDLVCNSEQLCTADPATSCIGTSPVDGPLAPPDAAGFCYGGPKLASVCFAAMPAGAQKLQSVSTDACPGEVRTLQGSVSACVISGDVVSLRGGTITGARPLVVVASVSITIAGTTTISAGAAACNTLSGGGVSFGTGGAGGAYQGAGGNGQPAPAFAATPGMQGTPYTEPFPIRGGCQGGNGGNGGATGGAGGGALVLLAPSITMIESAALVAPGRGGGGAVAKDSGGGGGGSGGLLALYAEQVTLDQATLVAAGGGGGGGAGDSKGAAGTDGISPFDPGFGGAGGLALENEGGDGSGPQAPNGTGLPNAAPDGGSGGGGGGGGGAGWIAIWANSATDSSSATSPVITMNLP